VSVGGTGPTCPGCGAARDPDALFCEECAYDFTGGRATQELAMGGPPAAAAESVPAGPGPDARHQGQVRAGPAPPITARTGEESPLDVGWTGAVARGGPPGAPPVPAGAPTEPSCVECGAGVYLDGYCDHCGSKARDPRDHFTESPAPWVGGVCDIGIRHTRNEDAMALGAHAEPLSFAVLVVCDGVSRSTDSHIASLAASRAARDVLDDPVPRGMGTRAAIVGAVQRRLGEAVQAAERAVVETTKDATAPNPPSCTFVAALVDNGLAVVGNVGDSRAYWLPDDPAVEPRQLTRDDSFAAQQMDEGVPRKEAESGAQAHAITRWLGSDSPDDLTPHTAAVDLDGDGWLMVCTDGLWNYCSEAVGLRDLVRGTVARLGAPGRNPETLAQALVDFANEQGGADNITVAFARAGATAPPATAPPATVPPATVPPATVPPGPSPEGPAPASAPPTTEGEVPPDGTVHR